MKKLKISSFKFYLLFAVSLVNIPVSVLAVTHDDFAYSAKLQTTPGTPFYELDIPETVYRQVSREDLGDIRVLNSSGEVIPHGLRNVPTQKLDKEKTQSVPYYPLYVKQGDKNAGMHLNIQRNATGEVIDIKRNEGQQAAADRLSGYLLDLREWKDPVDTIKVSWSETLAESFIHKIKISGSNDLSTWKTISTDKSLVNLSYQSHQLTENIITINSGRIKYIKILFEESKPGIELGNIEVSNVKSSSQQKQNWIQANVEPGSKAGEYLFEREIKTVINKARIKLPENNTLVKVNVSSRQDESMPWRYRGSAIVYRLTVSGVSIEHTDISLNSSRDNDWKLVIDQQGGGIGNGVPVVELVWNPQQLVFVARGEPPYTLVWGSARVSPVNINAGKIMIGVNNKNRQAMLSKAQWRKATVQTVNLESLQPESKPVNWRQGVLWGILVIAAMLLIWMAIRLMGKMSE